MSAEPNATPAPSVSIVRMAPGDQRLTFEFSAGGSAAGAALFANVRLLTSGEWDRYPCRGESATIAPLLNGADYEIRITAETPDGTVLCRSADRLFRCGFVPGTVVAYLHPEDDKMCIRDRLSDQQPPAERPAPERVDQVAARNQPRHRDLFAEKSVFDRVYAAARAGTAPHKFFRQLAERCG